MDKRKQLHHLVRRTIHHDWDPIGVVKLNGPEDEYHAYADQVYQQLLQRWEPPRIADYLHQIATERMGLSKTPYALSLMVASCLSRDSLSYL